LENCSMLFAKLYAIATSDSVVGYCIEKVMK